MMTTLKLFVQEKRHETVVIVEGNMTMYDAHYLKNFLPSLIEEGRSIYVDLSKVRHIDISGLNSLLITKLLSDEANTPFFVVCEENHALFDVLKRTKFKNQFEFRDTLISSANLSMAS